MYKIILTLIICLVSIPTMAIELEDVFTNEVKFGPVIHETLPEPILNRVRAVTDAFESIGGISYEQTVNFYKTKIDFEDKLVISEEMLRVYSTFCEKRCISSDEKNEAYNALLIRSIFSNEKALKQLEFNYFTKDEIIELISEYKLPPTLE